MRQGGGGVSDEVTMNTVVRVLKDAGEFDRVDRFYKYWCIGRVELDDLHLDSITDSVNVTNSAPISSRIFCQLIFSRRVGEFLIQKL